MTHPDNRIPAWEVSIVHGPWERSELGAQLQKRHKDLTSGQQAEDGM